MEFKKLIVARYPTYAISVVTQDATAEHFGWDKAFEEQPIGAQWDPIAEAWKPRWQMNRDPRWPGGVRLRICRSARKQGYPQGLTHCFRMQGSFSRKHLLALAKVAGEKFEWMEGASGKRISRDVWLASSR